MFVNKSSSYQMNIEVNYCGSNLQYRGYMLIGVPEANKKSLLNENLGALATGFG